MRPKIARALNFHYEAAGDEKFTCTYFQGAHILTVFELTFSAFFGTLRFITIFTKV